MDNIIVHVSYDDMKKFQNIDTWVVVYAEFNKFSEKGEVKLRPFELKKDL